MFMKTNFTQQNFRTDIHTLVENTPGWSVTRLARKSEVDQASLSRFCKGKSGLSGANIEKLWPFIYGDQKPNQPEN
ncbi:helix-turn-helix transcriptional regulator [Desulfovibrio sp. UCD-KL4C]|uniref:helix-turn-helix domain-containing protein n=1 Tax=Desulfovibrio sp. UCD-KL4C TaxID=2578120 RepID=UPI0025C550DC|nr:helix-turn-helix transcriptional regulator [Desulfovibrio sp. UCD-KL4C]